MPKYDKQLKQFSEELKVIEEALREAQEEMFDRTPTGITPVGLRKFGGLDGSGEESLPKPIEKNALFDDLDMLQDYDRSVSLDSEMKEAVESFFINSINNIAKLKEALIDQSEAKYNDELDSTEAQFTNILNLIKSAKREIEIDLKYINDLGSDKFAPKIKSNISKIGLSISKAYNKISKFINNCKLSSSKKKSLLLSEKAKLETPQIKKIQKEVKELAEDIKTAAKKIPRNT